MAKSLRSKREKRLRAIRREIVEPHYQKKDEAKLAALEAALAAPKLPAPAPASASASMQLEEQQITARHLNSMGTYWIQYIQFLIFFFHAILIMLFTFFFFLSFSFTEVEMADSDQSKGKASLKAVGGVGKKSKNKLKLAKKKRRSGGKGNIRGKRNL